MNRWSEVYQLIQKADKILMSTHVNPDGDGLGSEAALYYSLKKQGKDCRILNPSGLNEEYQQIFDFTKFEEYDRAAHRDWLVGVDLAIIFDIGDYNRLNEIGEDLKDLNVTTLSIDHHPHRNPNWFMHTLHDLSASATGYLVYDYLCYAADQAGEELTLGREEAEGLYVALMTDTGSFRYSNTTPEAHEMASELIRQGVEPYELYAAIYESSPVERLRLLGAALESIRIAADGALAWFTVTRDMMWRTGGKSEHIGGFTDMVRSVKGAEVALMINEQGDDRCRINFRSKGKIKINSLARKLGGGGHEFAAGATVRMSLDEAISKIVPMAEAEIETQIAKMK
ncbi:MAG TPA: bifunctional oligoribonuclease/PAP phosphatase NrnA [Candidatus Marinimicrobia bacterium]|jgi:phosphoesterase RecJ-like protein|nr:bifunctional oligoribonuclease/PAP phosphatase NrnA [Candidatus Neomarinimicrobiota bacterium]